MSGKAIVEIRDTIRVWIEFRTPKKGELTWAVPSDATPEQALDHVITGRDVWSAGEAGFAWRAPCDMPEFDEAFAGLCRNIVVHVDYVRTEPKLDDVITHVKLL